jgi:hypothetical protein
MAEREWSWKVIKNPNRTAFATLVASVLSFSLIAVMKRTESLEEG